MSLHTAQLRSDARAVVVATVIAVMAVGLVLLLVPANPVVNPLPSYGCVVSR